MNGQERVGGGVSHSARVMTVFKGNVQDGYVEAAEFGEKVSLHGKHDERAAMRASLGLSEASPTRSERPSSSTSGSPVMGKHDSNLLEFLERSRLDRSISLQEGRGSRKAKGEFYGDSGSGSGSGSGSDGGRSTNCYRNRVCHSSSSGTIHSDGLPSSLPAGVKTIATCPVPQGKSAPATPDGKPNTPQSRFLPGTPAVLYVRRPGDVVTSIAATRTSPSPVSSSPTTPQRSPASNRKSAPTTPQRSPAPKGLSAQVPLKSDSAPTTPYRSSDRVTYVGSHGIEVTCRGDIIRSKYALEGTTSSKQPSARVTYVGKNGIPQVSPVPLSTQRKPLPGTPERSKQSSAPVDSKRTGVMPRVSLATQMLDPTEASNPPVLPVERSSSHKSTISVDTF